CKAQDHDKLERLFALEPSASTLVVMVHFMVLRVLGGCGFGDDEQAIQHRLMLRSLAEDGEFARLALRGLAECWMPKVSECLKAAVAADEALTGRWQASSSGCSAHHLPAMIMTHLRPAQPVVDYGVARDKLAEQVVWFILRGMGLKEEAIQRYYNPRA